MVRTDSKAQAFLSPDNGFENHREGSLAGKGVMCKKGYLSVLNELNIEAQSSLNNSWNYYFLCARILVLLQNRFLEVACSKYANNMEIWKLPSDLHYSVPRHYFIKCLYDYAIILLPRLCEQNKFVSPQRISEIDSVY